MFQHPTSNIPRRAASDGSPAMAKEKEQTGKHQTFMCSLTMFSDVLGRC